MLKTCTRCKVSMNLSSFGKRHRDGGFMSVCLECHRLYRREHYHANKEPYLARARIQSVAKAAARANAAKPTRHARPSANRQVARRPWSIEKARAVTARWLSLATSANEGCLLHSADPEAGYLRVRVFGALDGAHRIVLSVKLGRELAKGEVCRHTCDVQACLNPDHLIEGTFLDNIDDMMKRGRNVRGEQSPHARLTAEKVRSMRAAHRDMGMRPVDLGVIFGVSTRCASDVVNAISWKHVSNSKGG